MLHAMKIYSAWNGLSAERGVLDVYSFERILTLQCAKHGNRFILCVRNVFIVVWYRKNMFALNQLFGSGENAFVLQLQHYEKKAERLIS